MSERSATREELVGRCYCCGKFVNKNEAWYQKVDGEDDESDVEIFCDENCADKKCVNY